MRLIDADEVTRKLNKRKAIFCREDADFFKLPLDERARVDEINDCILTLCNTPSVNAEPHWIPVTKQPPEVGKSVMICDAYGDICIGHRTRSGYYFPDFCDDKIKDVRAWAELPEPFKGVTE